MGLIEFIILAGILCLAAHVVITVFHVPSPINTIIWGAIALILLLIFVRATGFDIAIPRLR